MSLSNTISRVQYAGNNSTSTPYAVPFVFFDAADLQVFLDDGDTPLLLESDYVVTGMGDPSGGAISTNIAYLPSRRITVVRTVPATQEAEFAEGDKFPAESFERALDRDVMLAQQTQRAVERSIRGNEASEPFTKGFVSRADTVISLDHSGQPATRNAMELFSFLGINPTFAAEVSECVDVLDYGAKGDGVTDDYPAITAALAAATTGPFRRLYFPPNRTYRIGTAGVHGLHLVHESDLEILMGPGSWLVMDNMVAGNGVSHGIFVQGPCENVTLRGCRVKYAAMSVSRQTWSPIFFIGANISATGTGAGAWYRGAPGAERPDLIEAGACKNVQVLDCETMNSPSVMLGLAGIDGASIVNFKSDYSRADGIYQLYCRNTVINGARLSHVGDDATSFASYESDFAAADINNAFHSENSVAGNVIIDGYFPFPNVNGSGGIALLGVRGVSISNYSVRNKFRGIRFECGTEATSPYPFLSMLANQDCVISNVTIENSFQGISCINKEVTFADDDKWWRHKVTISNVISDNINSPFDSHYCLNVYGDAQYTGGTIHGIMCGFTLDNLRFHHIAAQGGTSGIVDCTFRNIEFDGTFGFNGYTPYRGDLSLPGYPPNHCRFIGIRAQSMQFTTLKNCWFDGLVSESAGEMGVTFSMCADCTFGTITVKNSNRAAAAFPGGVLIDDLSERICGDLVIFDQDEVSVPNALSIQNGHFHFVKKVIVKTALNTFYRMVADKGFQATGISQVGSIDWYHSANSNPRWQSIEYPAGLLAGEYGNLDFDYFPDTSPRTIQIKFPLSADRVATIHEGGAYVDEQVSIVRSPAATGAFAFQIVGQAEGTPEIFANPARATFRITAGTYDPGVSRISEIRVDGVNILPAPIDWGSVHNYENNNEFVAAKVAAAIHASGGLYDAISSVDLVWLTANAPGASYNGKILSFVVGGDVVISHVTDFSGGIDHQAAGATPAPYAIGTLAAPGDGLRLIYHYPAGWEVLHKLSV